MLDKGKKINLPFAIIVTVFTIIASTKIDPTFVILGAGIVDALIY
ncbi:MAG: hypothetical protein ACP5JP_04635 [bacterium]